jgi:hypothetical protein
MEVLNDVLGKSTAREPPMRNVEGIVTEVRLRRIPSMHALTARGSNAEDTAATRLPAPEHLLLTTIDEPELSEVIEKHIDYVDKAGCSVHLGAPFVKHFRIRSDGALPSVTGVATMPMVLPTGDILSGRGLDRQRGILFRVPSELESILPAREQYTPAACGDAMRFLVDDWLCDVSTDYPGKSVIIAVAATILERLVLPERPAFFISAGQRGNGKTTAINMITVAALGMRAAAAAWSPNEEERRKALFAYLAEGVALISWDNIPRGLAISCQSIEKALTAETYSDRVLGYTEIRTVPATSIQAFTGNNISPRGDLASRALMTRMSVDRPDPENRNFVHPDPIAWTEAHRGQILRALYTIILGNPRLVEANPPVPETRFKAWWHLVGSAIEHAARQHVAIELERVKWLAEDANRPGAPAVISFREMFLAGESDEEQASALATVPTYYTPNGQAASSQAMSPGLPARPTKAPSSSRLLSSRPAAKPSKWSRAPR